MRLVNLLVLVLLVGGSAFIAAELLRGLLPANPTDRCVEAAPSARQAFEAGPMASNGRGVAEMNAPQRVDAPTEAVPGLILCRAETVFNSGARETMWYALVPTQGGTTGQFMIHAAPGEIGRRNILAIR